MRLNIDYITGNKNTLYGFVILLCLSRFLFLDMDTPSMFVSNLCAEDEAYYCPSSIEKYLIEKTPYAKAPHSEEYIGLMQYSYYPVYFSIKLLGNNFWGLRLFPVLLSILSSLLIVSSLKRVVTHKSLLLLGATLVCLDFSFFMYSRYNGPQIVSIFSISLILWVFIKYIHKNNFHVFLLGFIAFFSVSFIYVYNLYLIGAFGLYFTYISIKEKNIKYVFYYGLGIIVCFLVYAIVLKLCGSSLSLLIKSMQDHGGELKKTGEVNSSIISFIATSITSNLKPILSSLINNNLFRYNQAFLILTTLAIGYGICHLKKPKAHNIVLSLILVLAITQFLFSPSYPIKKLVVLLPVFVLLSFGMIDGFINEINKTIITLNKKIVYISFILLGAFLVTYNFKVMTSSISFDYYIKLFGNYTPPNFSTMVFQLIMVLSLTIILIIMVFKNKIHVALIFPFIILPSLVFIIYYTTIAKSYLIRNALIENNIFLKSQFITGDFGYYYQFYSDAIPFYNTYGLVKAHPQKIEYLNDSLFKVQKTYFEMKKILPPSLYNTKLVGDTVTEENKKYVIITKHNLENYKYTLVKRIK